MQISGPGKIFLVKGIMALLSPACTAFTAQNTPTSAQLPLQITQTSFFSPGTNATRERQLPAQYLADVDTSDEDSVQGPRATSQHPKQRGWAALKSQVMVAMKDLVSGQTWEARSGHSKEPAPS